MREDRERQILGRYNSWSVLAILRVPHVRSILFCSWFIYLKYQMVNHRMLNIDQINEYYTTASTLSQSSLEKALYLFIAIVFQTCLSFLISKFLFGRSITITYVIFAVTTVVDIAQAAITFRYHNTREGAEPMQIVFLFRATLVYILYFTIC